MGRTQRKVESNEIRSLDTRCASFVKFTRCKTGAGKFVKTRDLFKWARSSTLFSRSELTFAANNRIDVALARQFAAGKYQ